MILDDVHQGHDVSDQVRESQEGLEPEGRGVLVLDQAQEHSRLLQLLLGLDRQDLIVGLVSEVELVHSASLIQVSDQGLILRGDE